MTRIDTKDALSSAVGRVEAICGKFGIDSLAPQRAACEELLAERAAGAADTVRSDLVAALVGDAEAGNRGEEIRTALAELAAVESGLS
jgi:hypothetical protein